jgi:integrase
MKTYTYTSAFSTDITGLIEQKQALGYKYETEGGVLKRFDEFCRTHYPDIKSLNKDMVLQWCKPGPGEHPATLQVRVTPVRELARYMIRNGYPAFIPPKGIMPKSPRYLPYIYSDEQIRRIFSQIDRCHYCAEVPLRQYVMPLFFRLLYCCGLRLSEARMIKVKDVDMENYVITLTNTKSGRHRQIALPEKLHDRFKVYHQRVHLFSEPESWYFPGYKGKPMTLSNVDKNHRKFLWQAGISHCGRARQGQRGAPCVHSYRHTFAVHRLRQWMREGKNIQAYLPLLQAHMGHVSYSDTAYYLHLTVDVFPDITERLESEFGNIIPIINHTNYNSDEKDY